jgi:hypothetical protein
MRHSDPSLTANIYTDPRLLDIYIAVDVLPALPLNVGQIRFQISREQLGQTVGPLAPLHQRLHQLLTYRINASPSLTTDKTCPAWRKSSQVPEMSREING